MDTVTTAPTPTIPTGDAPDILTFTQKAVDMVKAAIEQEGLTDHGIRIGVAGGGCSGFQYTMDFENALRDGDLVVEQFGLKLYVDPMSAMYLQGVTIDYVQGLQGAGFKFINPNAKNTCGCGSSFSA